MSDKLILPSGNWPIPLGTTPQYTACRIDQPLSIDGDLTKDPWRYAPRSPRFVDLVYGTPAIHDTRAAVLWDDNHLYVGYWVEEPIVRARLTERNAPIYEDNDVELFIAGEQNSALSACRYPNIDPGKDWTSLRESAPRACSGNTPVAASAL